MIEAEVMLSVVIVGQNNAAYLRSVLEQAVILADEVVFVDGGSSDRTLEIARSFASLRVFERPFDGDIASQKNYGFQQARGRWILALDTDELVSPRLGRFLPGLLRIPFVAWYELPRYWLVEQQGRVGYLRSRLHYPDRQLRLFRNRPGMRYPDSTSRIHHHLDPKTLGFGIRLPWIHIFHYCFLILSEKEIRAKIERYAAMDPDSAETNLAYVWDREGVELRALREALPGMLRVQHDEAPGGAAVECSRGLAAPARDSGQARRSGPRSGESASGTRPG